MIDHLSMTAGEKMSERIKKQIKKIIKKNDFLFALAHLVQNRKNKELMKAFADTSNVVIIQPSVNCLNKSPVCFLDVDTICGLFWYVRVVLEMLYYCDCMGFVPQIQWSKSLYYDESITNTNNPFEYYFKQPKAISDDELLGRPTVIYAPGKSLLVRKFIGAESDLYIGSDQYVDALSTVAKKSFFFNSETKAVIENFINKYSIDDESLGVHARGTDFRNHYYGHPVFIEPAEYFEYVDHAISEYGFKKVFLATDDQRILDEFLAHYSHIPIMYSTEVRRGLGNQGIHTNSFSDSSVSKYAEGLTALCDMEALASCGGLISGVSNLPLIARIMRKRNNKSYIYDKVIYKGINSKGIDVSNESFSNMKNNGKQQG